MAVPEQRGLHALDDRSESRVGRIVGAIMGFVVLLLLIWIAVQQGNVVDETHELNQKFNDCTSANGKCYQSAREQAKMDAAMQTRVNVTAAWCLRNSPANASPADIANCVDKELAKFSGPPKTTP